MSSNRAGRKFVDTDADSLDLDVDDGGEHDVADGAGPRPQTRIKRRGGQGSSGMYEETDSNDGGLDVTEDAWKQVNDNVGTGATVQQRKKAGRSQGYIHDCSVCGKQFTRTEHLQRHILATHEGRKDFRCDVCEKSFGRRDERLRHLRTHVKNGQITEEKMAAMVAANAPGSAGASSASPPTENLVSKRRAKIPAPPALKIDRNAEDSGSSTPDANGSRSTRSASVDVSMKGDQGVQLRSAPVYRTVLSVETQSAMTGPFSRNADYESAAFHTIQTTQYTSPLSSGDSSASMLPLVYSGYKCPANGCDSEFVDLASCQQHFAILHSTEDPFSTASQMTSPFTAIQSPNSATTNGSTHPPNLSLLTLDNAAIAGAPGRSWTNGADLTSASLSSSNSVTVVNSGFSPIPYGGFEPSLAYPGPPFQNAPGEGYSSTQPNLSISEDDTLLRLFNQEYPQLFTNAGLSSPGLFPPSDPPPPAPLSASSYFSQNNEFQPIQYMQPTVVLSSQPLPRHSRTQSLSSTVVHHHPHSQPPLSPQYISFTSTTSANPSIQANMVVDYSLNANGTVTAAGPSATNLRLRRGSRVTQLLQEERANLVQQVLRDRERESRLKDSQGNHVESMSLSDGEFCEGVGSSALHTPAALLDPASVGLEPTLVPDNAMPNEAMRLESSSHVMLFDPTHRVKEESDL